MNSQGYAARLRVDNAWALPPVERSGTAMAVNAPARAGGAAPGA